MLNELEEQGRQDESLILKIDAKQVEGVLGQYFNHDLVLLPFFFDEAVKDENHRHVFYKSEETGEMQALCGCAEEKRCVLVSVKVLDNQVDLFDKEYREHDNHDISNSVLKTMELASHIQNIELNEELIDADTENMPGVETDEDMITMVCYIAECFTFGKEPAFEELDIKFQRQHIVDTILRVLSFK
jgi:hypothetical protein